MELPCAPASFCPAALATVETLLRQTGDLDFRRDSEPTGLFGVPLEEATRRFQRRNRLAVDGIVNPADETIQALERASFGREDADERRREAACVQNRVRLDNLQIEIYEATGDLEAASTTAVALSEEADRLNTRHALQLAIAAIPAGAAAAVVIRLGRGIVAALRAFVDAVDLAGLRDVQDEADDLADRFDRAIEEFEFRLDELQRLQEERRELVQAREALGCG